MTRATDYTNAAQQRLLQLIDLMAGHELQGLLPGEVAKALAVGASTVTRDLDNLKTAGIAERDEESGHWRLTPRLPQQAVRVWAAIDRAERRIDEAKARFKRSAD